jgi:hypothetical protein
MSLYDEFSSAMMSLPEDRRPDAIDAAEGLVIRLSRHHGMDAVFAPWAEAGRPTDPILRVFEGHTFRELVGVMTRLRGELADELVRGGASDDDVRELREGGVRADGRRGETARPETA